MADVESRFSVVDTTFNGFAALAAGQTGTCRAAYSFSGGGSVSDILTVGY